MCCRLDLLEIAVVRVQEATARAVHSNAEDDLDDSGLVDGSWRCRQEDSASLYRCTFSRRGADRGRFSPRQGRKELLQKFKREGLSVHERILLQTSLRALVQCLLDGFHTLRFLPSNLIAHERSGWAFMCSSPQFHDGRAQGRHRRPRLFGPLRGQESARGRRPVHDAVDRGVLALVLEGEIGVPAGDLLQAGSEIYWRPPVIGNRNGSIFEVFDDETDAINSFFPGRKIKGFDILSFVQQMRDE